MAYDPILMLIGFSMLAFGLLGLVLCIIGMGWFVTHPKENGESLLRGKRGKMFALSIGAILLVGVGALAFLSLLF